MAEIKLNWSTMAGQIIVATLVGMTSAYLSSTRTLAVVEERIGRIEKTVEALTTNQTNDEREARILRDKIIRLETKIDLLLERGQK